MASDKTEKIGKSLDEGLSRFGPESFGLSNKGALQYDLDQAKYISQADWSGVDSKIGTLSELADAFMEQYSNGSDIARAQNAQAAASFARNAQRSQASFAQLQNQGDQLVQQATQNTAQATQANLNQGLQAGNTAQQGEIHKMAEEMQRTLTNMEIARTKKNILDQAYLADRSGIQAATAFKNDALNNKERIDLGIQSQEWNNTLQAIQLIGGVAQGAAALGSGLAKKSTPDFASSVKGSELTESPVLTTGTLGAMSGITAPHSVYVNSRYGTGT